MLTVETYLDRSGVDGIGLFAARDIAEGEIIWRFHPETEIHYDEKDWRILRREIAAPCFRAMEKYAYKHRGRYVLDLDDGRFMNHSASAANVGGGDPMTALRPIKRGEELLCDYSLFCDEDDPVMAAEWL